MLEKSLLLKAKNIPNTFGIYMFIDINKSPIYVGKSNNLKTRVLSYFKKKTEKDELIIKNAHNIDYVLVNNENDAFLLENNLIKKYQPKYNILLKDDKNYPWLCITNERFPRLLIVRKKQENKNIYFGPYLSKKHLQNLYSFIISYYPIRSCKFDLSKENIKNKKYKVCLDYHLKKCDGPCEGLQKEMDYNKNINSIKNLLNGKYSKVIKELEKKLSLFSNKLLFEKAEEVKNQIFSLNKLKHKSIIVSPKNVNIDSFYIIEDDKFYYVNFIRVIEGSIIFLKNLRIKNINFWSLDFIFYTVLSKFYVDLGSLSKEIISNINYTFRGKPISNPKVGYKKEILNLGLRNLNNYINKKYNNKHNNIVDLKKDLKLKNIPFVIECFDISHLKGKYTIGSCVVFKNGKPSKKDYRFYNIKSFEGINDYLAIEEVLNRRYIKLKKLPDLIVIDGGKGQLSSAKKVINKLKIKKLEFLSIAKKEEIIYKENGTEIILDKKSKSLKLIQQLRDEAHRFCLKNHRKKREKYFIKTELDSVPGIGHLTVKKLLKQFKSTKKMRMLDKEELISFIGKSKGLKVYEYLRK